jgi:hypothetical protein
MHCIQFMFCLLRNDLWAVGLTGAGALCCMPLHCLQVCAVLLYAQQNNVEPFLEPVLQLADAMMARDASDMAAGASNGQLLQCFLGQLLCFMDLCTHPDAAVAVAASQCMAQLVRDGTGGDDACARCRERSLARRQGAHLQQLAPGSSHSLRDVMLIKRVS